MRTYVAFMIAALLIGSLRSACLRNTSLTLRKSHNTSKATSGERYSFTERRCPMALVVHLKQI
jgi:hypothetical protein